MKLWTEAEVQAREQQVIEKCAQIAYDYGAQHPYYTATSTANGIRRAIEAFGRIVADDIADESDGLQVALAAVLERAALVADEVEAKAEPGHGKETAAEIGRRIRAPMEGRDE